MTLSDRHGTAALQVVEQELVAVEVGSERYETLVLARREILRLIPLFMKNEDGQNKTKMGATCVDARLDACAPNCDDQNDNARRPQSERRDPIHVDGMKTVRYPWNDAAVLVLLDKPDDRHIAAEGTLRQIANRIALRPESEWHRFLISMPDRGAPPFSFDAPQFHELIRQLSR